MSNVAILVGNSAYSDLQDITCCHDDLAAIKELLHATNKFSHIEVIEDTEADHLKSLIRTVIDKSSTVNEVFFYFTGHGFFIDHDLYFCAKDFDPKRPNQTGLSNEELHVLLRQANADLVVKVIDACNSGVLLIKGNNEFPRYDKSGFKNLIQISSCLDSQNSLTGDPLSHFTEKFRNATLRKTEGVVFYTDIINTLKDEFIGNDEQTPYFISQVTGREKFVDDAGRLADLRKEIMKDLEAQEGRNSVAQAAPVVPPLQVLLEKAEKRVGKPEVMSHLIGKLFDDVVARVSTMKFEEFFDVEIEEQPDYSEVRGEEYIVRILSKEKRTDEFVTAKIRRERKRNPWGRYSAAAILGMFGSNEEYEEVYDLWLNMRLERAQLKVTFVPKYAYLKKVELVVTCVPSLEKCYIFEIGSEHRLIDFGNYHLDGKHVTRRWYNLNWDQSTDVAVDMISTKLGVVIRTQLSDAMDRLKHQ